MKDSLRKPSDKLLDATILYSISSNDNILLL